MDATMLQSIIGNYGFPIVCCILMIFTTNKSLQKNHEATQNLSGMIQSMSHTLNNLSNLITRFMDAIDADRVALQALKEAVNEPVSDLHHSNI